MSRPYRPFQVLGLELEYVVVDRDLKARALVADAFRALHGRPTSDVEHRDVAYSSELAAHVFEIKTVHPVERAADAERRLMRGVREFLTVLDRRFGARLLPTGMHPFLRPREATLWPRAGAHIYRAYQRIFSTRGHGWVNVQASHVNLPFGTERETIAMHTAAACLLPYLPALAASSPIFEGRFGAAVDNRLVFYRSNQRRIPLIAGDVIPEVVTSYADYRRRILRRIYAELARVREGNVLRHEWVNSRGAILRFMRRAMEIRVLDMQECVRADVAIAAFVRAALAALAADLEAERITPAAHRMLVRDFNATVRRGSEARVEAPHLLPRGRGGAPVRRVLAGLLERARDFADRSERSYFDLVEERIARGSLSERIARAVQRAAPSPGPRRRRVIRDLYAELAQALERNEPWTE